MLDYTSKNADNEKWNNNKKVVHDAVFSVLKERLKDGGKQQKDLLADLLKSYNDAGFSGDAAAKMDHLGANLVELLFAGYNTVVNTLANAVHLLANNPH